MSITQLIWNPGTIVSFDLTGLGNVFRDIYLFLDQVYDMAPDIRSQIV